MIVITTAIIDQQSVIFCKADGLPQDSAVIKYNVNTDKLLENRKADF